MLSRNEIKYIQTLFHKKNRDEQGLFIAEGVKIADELIASGFTMQKVYALQDWANAHANLPGLAIVTEEELKKLSKLETPNKVVAVVQKKEQPAAISDNVFTVVLDGIQDPGNLGTIIRTADWFGVTQVVASPDTADVYNSKVVQSTMGSIARVDVHYAPLEDYLSHTTLPVYGAMLNGRDIADIEPAKPCLLVIGNESRGIRPNVQPFIQEKIAIPKIGGAESLNAAVAAGILLFKLCAG